MNISVWSSDGRRVVAVPHPARRKALFDGAARAAAELSPQSVLSVSARIEAAALAAEVAAEEAEAMAEAAEQTAQLKIKNRLKIAAVQAIICQLWGIKPQQLTGESRCMDFVYPRWAAMLFASERLAWSTPRIGRAFGDRDHTTVMHGINRAKELLADRRQPFTELYRQLEDSL